MATNKLNLNEIEKELDKLLADRAAEVEKARKMLIDAEKLAGKAESELAAAEEKDSVEAYAAAAQKKRAADDTVDFYQKKLERLERSPISAVDSGSMKAEITAGLDRMNTAAMGKVVELVSQIQEIAAELDDEITRANRILKTLQENIAKNTGVNKWEYDKWELVRFCTQFANSSWYQELVKKGGVGK